MLALHLRRRSSSPGSFLQQLMAKPTNLGKEASPPKVAEERRDHLALSQNETIRIFKGDNLELENSWTIEAIARLDRIHPSAHVNTLLSHSAWNHQNKAGAGSQAKSAYEPLNFIMQLTGENAGGDVYRVIDSNLRIP